MIVIDPTNSEDILNKFKALSDYFYGLESELDKLLFAIEHKESFRLVSNHSYPAYLLPRFIPEELAAKYEESTGKYCRLDFSIRLESLAVDYFIFLGIMNP